MSTDILIGVAISLLTSALSSIGVNLQALALQRERDLNLAVETPLLDPFAHDDNDLHQIDSTHGQIPGKGTRIWQWYLGFALYVSCQCFGSLIALNFISPMILAPLGSAGLIFNIVFSYAFLNTVISNLDYLGTLLIMIGCGLISTFGVDSPQTRM